MNIVFLGDSVTQGCFDILKNDVGDWQLIIEPESSYVNLIDKMIKSKYPDKVINVINSGISGDSTSEALNRVEKDVLSYNPDITVVCLGLNNSCRRNIPEFCSQLTEIFRKIKSVGSKIIFLTPNMLNTYVDTETPDYLVKMAKDCALVQNSGEMDNLIKSGIETACSFDAVICDAYSEWKKLQYYGIDTTALLCNHINHPKREMHRLFADMLFELLKEMI